MLFHVSFSRFSPFSGHSMGNGKANEESIYGGNVLKTNMIKLLGSQDVRDVPILLDTGYSQLRAVYTASIATQNELKWEIWS